MYEQEEINIIIIIIICHKLSDVEYTGMSISRPTFPEENILP